MEITKMLTLSTAHITEDTANKLDRDPNDNNLGLCVYPKSDYGWFIYVNVISYKTSNHGLPEDLYNCLIFAHELGCDILCFDCDGPIEPFLPTYEW